ncbi:MAG: hypothetical protein M3273_03040 [Actinomycetota bacterium]|nr:hypothetical protein [Actinomycetota bacterium]
MAAGVSRLGIVACLLCATVAVPAFSGAAADAAPVDELAVEASSARKRDACLKGYGRRREVAHGRFLDRRWELSFYRGARDKPCLADEWSAYGSIFRFRVRERRPRLGMLNLAATSPPRVKQSVYVMEGYLSDRVARLTFRLAGKTDVVEVVRPRKWTRLPKDLFVHFVVGKRFDRDRTARLRAFGRQGRLLTSRILRRRQFYSSAEVD